MNGTHDLSNRVFVVSGRPSPRPGATKAYVDIQYHGVTIKGLSIVAHNGTYFVGFPSMLGKNNKRFPIIEFREPERSRIQELVLDWAKSERLV